MRGEVNLQRRHFEFLADVLRDSKSLIKDYDEYVALVALFANRLGRTNCQFKHDRFIDAVIVKKIVEEL